VKTMVYNALSSYSTETGQLTMCMDAVVIMEVDLEGYDSTLIPGKMKCCWKQSLTSHSL
jgi:hypothetical protein